MEVIKMLHVKMLFDIFPNFNFATVDREEEHND